MYFLAQEAIGFLLVIIYFIVFTLVVFIDIILIFSAFNEKITVKHQFSGNYSAKFLVIKKYICIQSIYTSFFLLLLFKKRGGKMHLVT